MKPQRHQVVRTVFGLVAKGRKWINITVFPAACIGIGAVSWAFTPLVSSTFAPWSSRVGLLINQSILCITAWTVGLRARMRMMPLSVLLMYIGQNLYIDTFGSNEYRSHAEALLISTAMLCILPLVTGTIAAGIHLVRAHHILLISRKERMP